MNELLKEQARLTSCPECDAWLRFMLHPEIGDVVLCSECTTKLEVQETFPLTLDWHFEKPFGEDEQFYDENWDESNHKGETDHSFQWADEDENETAELERWFLEEIDFQEKAKAHEVGAGSDLLPQSAL